MKLEHIKEFLQLASKSREELEFYAASLFLDFEEFKSLSVEQQKQYEVFFRKYKSDYQTILSESPKGVFGLAHQGGMHHQKTNSAKNSARKKLEKDPKQKAKQSVRAYWDRWQKDRNLYPKGKAEFARDMLEKHPALESTKVIEDWCRKWEKELKTLSQQAN